MQSTFSYVATLPVAEMVVSHYVTKNVKCCHKITSKSSIPRSFANWHIFVIGHFAEYNDEEFSMTKESFCLDPLTGTLCIKYSNRAR